MQKHDAESKTLRETTLTKDGYTYRYTLCCEDNNKIYSLKIVMTSSLGISHQSSASVAVSDGRRALEFYTKLVRNLATPANLAYCIEDERL